MLLAMYTCSQSSTAFVTTTLNNGAFTTNFNFLRLFNIHTYNLPMNGFKLQTHVLEKNYLPTHPQPFPLK